MVKHQLVLLVLLFYSVFVLLYRIANVLVVIKTRVESGSHLLTHLTH